MNLLLKQNICPACRTQGEELQVKTKVCGYHCIRINGSYYVDGSSHQEAPQLHMHVTCINCEFTWLEVVPDAQAIAKAW